MTRLVLINGAPGSGKSTVASGLARDRPLTLALDIDVLKHSLGQWDQDPIAAGLLARRLSLALVREQLSAGHDVVIGQYLARPDFIEDLEGLAAELGVAFDELVLDLTAPALAERLAARSVSPTRAEQLVNNELAGPHDAAALVDSLRGLRDSRPHAVWVDAQGALSETLDRVRTALDG